MEISIRPAARLSAANKLVDDIFYNKDSYYLFFGKTKEWGNIDIPTNSPAISEVAEREIRDSTIFYKRVENTDISLSIPRYDWESGQIYAAWDDAIDMSSEKFFVLTEDFNIYKCLDNNMGAPSTVRPTGTPFTHQTTSDGYVWKYMYTIPPAKRSKFISADKIPVQRAFTDSFYSNGAIEKVLITSGGAGYSMTPTVTISVSGTTVGSGALIKINSVDGDGGILTVQVVDPGSGYQGSCDLVIAGPGSGAKLTAVISSGSIESVTVDLPGIGYVVNSNITTTTGGASLIPVVYDGSLQAIKIVNRGSGYSGIPTLTVNGSGHRKYNTGPDTAQISPLMLNGRIDGVIITDPGTGYTQGYSTTLSIAGDGADADLLPVIDAGEIIDVYIANPGYGYSTAVITATSSPAATESATLTAVMSNFDMTTNQSIVEQSAINGAIHRIVATSPGFGYVEGSATVAISGDGTGATCIPIIDTGQIVGYQMTNVGVGYTYAFVTITDAARDAADPAGTYEDASARVIISPTGGHGSNAPLELLSRCATITSSLRNIPTLTQINQEFRQFGLIKNLRTITTNARVSKNQSYECIIATFSSTTSLFVDSILTHEVTKSKYRVIYINDREVHLSHLGSVIESPLGDLQNENLTIFTCESVQEYPGINKYSGDMYFASNEVPFEIDDSNGIFIRTNISF